MSKQTCETCGATLPAPGATCRRCLMELAAGWKPESSAEPEPTKAPRPGTPPPEPGELAPLFPELEIEGLLGVGGMGAVYKARQKRLGRTVALKVLHAELSGDPMFVERFLREAQAMAKLAHPGIVAIHDFGERERRCYLVMEYVDGANLRGLMRQGLLAPRQALDVVRQLCDALQFAHDEGVVHRDIKPENVLVDTNGRVKIADFGLAKLLGAPAQANLTSAGQVMGTPHYMAPEQVEHPRDVDHRADLFSLGVVFYEMLTGELPLGRFAPPSERVQVDVRLDEIVLKSLEHQRERRYQHAAQVKTDVERVEHEPVPTKTPEVERVAEKSGVFIDVVAGTEQRHLHMRSGVYLPRLQAALGRHRPTTWGWLALLTAAWIVCGTSFNLGPLGFLSISVPLLTWLFLSLVAARTGADAAPDEQLGRWVTRFSPGAFAAASLGFLLLFLAHVASAERWTWAYVSSDQAPLAGLERWKGSELELLRNAGIQVDSRSDLSAADVRLETRSAHWNSSPYTPLGLHPVWLFLAALALLALAAAVTARAGPLSARERWRGAVVALGLLFETLAVVHLLTFALHGWTQRLDGVRASLECRGEAETLAADLRRALVAGELYVHAEHVAEIVDRRSGEPLGEVCTFAAAPASVFDRWHLTWSGARRIRPHVVFTVASDPVGEHAWILADGGMAEPSQLASSDWESELRNLLSDACEPLSEK